MKRTVLTTTFSSLLASALLPQVTFAQVNWSCRKAYSDAAVHAAAEARVAPYPSFSKITPSGLKEIDSRISELEKKISGRDWKRSSLQKDLAGEVKLFDYQKSDDLKKVEKLISEAESSIRSRRFRRERLEKDIEKAKTDADSSTDPFGILAFFIGKRKVTARELDNMKAELEGIRQKDDQTEGQIASLRKIRDSLFERDKAEILKKSRAELDEVLAKDEANRKELEPLRAERAQLLEKARGEAVAMMKDALKDSRLVSPTMDLLGYYSLRNLPKENKVTLLIGNQLNGNRMEYNLAAQMKELVQELIHKKYYVVFDAESSYAPYISQLAGDYGIPVMAKNTGKFTQHKNKVVINNDFLRMQILGEAQAVVASPDSVSGMGLFAEGLVSHVLDVKGNWEYNSVRDWISGLDKRDRNLGLKPTSAQIATRAGDLFRAPESGNSFGLKRLDKSVEKFKTFVPLKAEVLAFDGIERILTEAVSFAKVMDQNKETGGSVIFGSSREDKHSAQLIYQSAYKLGQLGIAVVTGGSGGAMEIANSGAWNSGGPSIGIPIGGKHTLDTEKTFASSKHTKTIVTSGYEERIPALLGEGLESRKLIIFAPGGNGTIKELATTLVRAAGKNDSFKKIVFLDSDYYGAFFKWLQESRLPDALKKKIVLIDKAEDLEALAQGLQEPFEKKRVQPPRKEQLNYEMKSSFSSKGKWLDSDDEWFGSSSSWTSKEKDKNKNGKKEDQKDGKNQETKPSSQADRNKSSSGGQNFPMKFGDPSEESKHMQDYYDQFGYD